MEGEDRGFILPALVTFSKALENLKSIADEKDTHLVALDQPTIVNNMTDSRPVDRVAGLAVKFRKKWRATGVALAYRHVR